MTRILGSAVVALALALSGCGIAWTADDLPPKVPDVTIGAPEPAPEPSVYDTESNLIPEDELECEAVPTDLLAHFEEVGNVGGAVRFTEGQMVAQGDGWWAVAVRQVIAPGTDYDPESYPEFVDFRSTAPGGGDDSTTMPWSGAASAAAKLARSCLGPAERQ